MSQSMIEHSTFRNESRFILLYIWYSFNGYTVTYMYRLNKLNHPLVVMIGTFKKKNVM